MKAVLLLALLILVGCNETLVHELDEQRANEIRLSLVRAGIAAQKERLNGKWSISVEKSEVQEALAVLGETRMLSSSQPETASTSGFMKSREERRLLVLSELSGSLERTIETLPGVDEARVHINQKEQTGWSLGRSEDNAGSASVLVIANKRVPFLKQNAARIVAGGVGIDTDLVSVVVEVRSYEQQEEKAPEAPRIIAVAPTEESQYFPVQVVQSKVVEAKPKPNTPNSTGKIVQEKEEGFNFGTFALGLVISGTAIIGHRTISKREEKEAAEAQLLRPKL